jgi:hypothetical protein
VEKEPQFLCSSASSPTTFDVNGIVVELQAVRPQVFLAVLGLPSDSNGQVEDVS